MPITQEKAQLAECDACGSRQWFHEVDDIEGVHGTVMVVHSGGGYSVAFYSCRDDSDHVGLAFTNAELLNELVDLQTMLGRTPSLDHTKKTLHIGNRRAKDLLYSLSPLPSE